MSQPTFSVASSLLLVALAAACSSTGSAPSPWSSTPTPDHSDKIDAGPLSNIERGRLAVEQRGCVGCHQSTDPKDGVLSGQTAPRPGTNAYPANLTPDKDTGMGEWTDEQILTAIRTGIDDEGGALCATMPRFTDLGEQEGVAILAYLRSLPATTREIPASTCAKKPVTADDAGHDDAATD